MIVFTKHIRQQILEADTPVVLGVVLHDLFMQASYGSKMHNLLGLASNMNDVAHVTQNREMFENLKRQLIEAFKFPILFL